MKLVYKDMGHILSFEPGYVIELVVENRTMFFNMVNSITMQSEGLHGDAVLSLSDNPAEFSRYVDVTVQFAPFQINRKSLLTKLYASLEQKAMSADYYLRSVSLLNELESFIQELTYDFPLDVECEKLAIGPVLRSVGPKIDENEISTVERIFEYMQLIRELDRDRLFIMINMRTYFSDEDMERFIQSSCLHDFKVLLLEGTSFRKLSNTKRYTIDEDLCEF